MNLGNKVYVISKFSQGQKEHELINGINVFRVGKPYNLTALRKITQLNGGSKIDIVHTHATSGPLYAILHRVLPKIKDTRHVAHVHGTTKGVLSAIEHFSPYGMHNNSFGKSLSRAISISREEAVWKRADLIIAVSEQVKNDLIRLYTIPSRVIHVVHNGVDLSEFRRRNSRSEVLRANNLKDDTKLILYVGGYRPIKGIFELVRALEILYKKDERIKVLALGNYGTDLERNCANEVKAYLRKMHLQNCFIELGNMPYNMMANLYSAADILVVPSLYDAFPKAPLEAMACETPVIASSVGGLADIAKRGGYVIDPADSDMLAEAIINMINDTHLKEELASRGLQLVRNEFTWKITVEKIFDAYHKVA